MFGTYKNAASITPNIGKKVRIAGEDFVEIGTLVDLRYNTEPFAEYSFVAFLKKESETLVTVQFESLDDMSVIEEQPEHRTMKKLSTIQKRENLNEVYRMGEEGPGGAYHDYDIYRAGFGPGRPANVLVAPWDEGPLACVKFQKGPRKDPGARHGVLDSDLLEIVRDRLKAFQSGEYATRENEMALMHIEEALLWMNKRVENRIERNVLGTMEK